MHGANLEYGLYWPTIIESGGSYEVSYEKISENDLAPYYEKILLEESLLSDISEQSHLFLDENSDNFLISMHDLLIEIERSLENIYSEIKIIDAYKDLFTMLCYGYMIYLKKNNQKDTGFKKYLKKLKDILIRNENIKRSAKNKYYEIKSKGPISLSSFVSQYGSSQDSEDEVNFMESLLEGAQQQMEVFIQEKVNIEEVPKELPVLDITPQVYRDFMRSNLKKLENKLKVFLRKNKIISYEETEGDYVPMSAIFEVNNTNDFYLNDIKDAFKDFFDLSKSSDFSEQAKLHPFFKESVSEEEGAKVLDLVNSIFREITDTLLKRISDLCEDYKKIDSGELSLIPVQNPLAENYYDMNNSYDFEEVKKEALQKAIEEKRMSLEENVKGRRQKITNEREYVIRRQRAEAAKMYEKHIASRYNLVLENFKNYFKNREEDVLKMNSLIEKYPNIIGLQFYLLASNYILGMNNCNFMDEIPSNNGILDLPYLFKQMIFSYQEALKEYINYSSFYITMMMYHKSQDDKMYLNILKDKLLELDGSLNREFLFSFFSYAGVDATYYAYFMQFLTFSLFIKEMLDYIPFFFPFEFKDYNETKGVLYSTFLKFLLYTSHHPVGYDPTLVAKRSKLKGFNYTIESWRKFADVIAETISSMNANFREHVFSYLKDNFYGFSFYYRVPYEHTHSTPPFLYKENDLRVFCSIIDNLKRDFQEFIERVNSTVAMTGLNQQYEEEYNRAASYVQLLYLFSGIILREAEKELRKLERIVPEYLDNEHIEKLNALRAFKDYYSRHLEEDLVKSLVSYNTTKTKDILIYIKKGLSFLRVYKEFFEYAINKLNFLTFNDDSIKSHLRHYLKHKKEKMDELIEYFSTFYREPNLQCLITYFKESGWGASVLDKAVDTFHDNSEKSLVRNFVLPALCYLGGVYNHNKLEFLISVLKTFSDTFIENRRLAEKEVRIKYFFSIFSVTFSGAFKSYVEALINRITFHKGYYSKLDILTTYRRRSTTIVDELSEIDKSNVGMALHAKDFWFLEFANKTKSIKSPMRYYYDDFLSKSKINNSYESTFEKLNIYSEKIFINKDIKQNVAEFSYKIYNEIIGKIEREIENKKYWQPFSKKIKKGKII